MSKIKDRNDWHCLCFIQRKPSIIQSNAKPWSVFFFPTSPPWWGRWSRLKMHVILFLFHVLVAPTTGKEKYDLACFSHQTSFSLTERNWSCPPFPLASFFCPHYGLYVLIVIRSTCARWHDIPQLPWESLFTKAGYTNYDERREIESIYIYLYKWACIYTHIYKRDHRICMYVCICQDIHTKSQGSEGSIRLEERVSEVLAIEFANALRSTPMAPMSRSKIESRERKKKVYVYEIKKML